MEYFSLGQTRHDMVEFFYEEHTDRMMRVKNLFSRWTEEDLRTQYTLAQTYGWVETIRAVTRDTRWSVAMILGIASRETGSVWDTHPYGAMVGEHGHGYGVMQIDERQWPDFCHGDAWKKVWANISQALHILDEKSAYLLLHGIPANLAPRGTIAAYNCGEGNVVNAIRQHKDVDTYTTHSNYGSDVVARSAVFQRFLTGEHFPGCRQVFYLPV